MILARQTAVHPARLAQNTYWPCARARRRGDKAIVLPKVIPRRPAGWTPLALRRLPQLVVAEASLGLLILLVTGLITAAPTAQGLKFAPSVETPSTLNQFVEDMVIGLTISPNKPGQNVFTVRARTTRRPPPAEVLRVISRFTYLEQESGMISVDAEEIEPDLYLIGGSQPNLAGKWQIDVVVRRKGLEDRVARFEWTVPQGGPPRPIIVSNQPWEPILTLAAALLLILILLVIAVVSYRLLQYEKIPIIELIK